MKNIIGIALLFILSTMLTANPADDLFSAVDELNTVKIDAALKAGADINKFNTMTLNTPLMQAVLYTKSKGSKRTASTIKFLLDNGASPVVTNNEGDNAFNTAYLITNTADRKAVLTMLLNRAMVPPKDFFSAAHRGLADVIDLYLLRGLPVNTADTQGMTGLHYAASFNGKHLYAAQTAAIKRLLSGGADINIKDRRGLTAYQHAFLSKSGEIHCNVQAIRIFLETGIDPALSLDKGVNPATIVPYINGNTAWLRYLISKKVPVLTDAASAGNPLFTSAYYGYFDLARLYIDKGYDAKARDTAKGTTVLYQVIDGIANRTGVSKTPARMLDLLIKNGADVNAQYDGGKTILFTASGYGLTAQVDYFLKKGVDVNHRDSNGQTALYTAIITNDRTKCAELLINRGASVTIKDKHGQTPLSLASSLNKESFMKLLKKHGAKE